MPRGVVRRGAHCIGRIVDATDVTSAFIPMYDCGFLLIENSAVSRKVTVVGGAGSYRSAADYCEGYGRLIDNSLQFARRQSPKLPVAKPAEVVCLIASECPRLFG